MSVVTMSLIEAAKKGIEMTAPKTILEMAAFRLNEASDLREIHGAETENARLMPIIQAQEERIKALRAALEPVAACGNCGGCRDSARYTLAADDLALESILRGEG